MRHFQESRSFVLYGIWKIYTNQENVKSKLTTYLQWHFFLAITTNKASNSNYYCEALKLQVFKSLPNSENMVGRRMAIVFDEGSILLTLLLTITDDHLWYEF